MFPTRYVERYFEHATPALREIVLELRNLVAAIRPNATEAVHPKGITYYDKERGGPVSAGICQISLHADHVRLEFVHGAFLPDPKRLLKQEGERKYKRYVYLDSYEQAPWDDLKELISASADFDPYALAGQRGS